MNCVTHTQKRHEGRELTYNDEALTLFIAHHIRFSMMLKMSVIPPEAGHTLWIDHSPQ